MTIPELIDRLQNAEGPSRELDAMIGYVSDWPTEMSCTFRQYCEMCDMDFAEVAKTASQNTSVLIHTLPRFSASIDAAQQFMRRVLKGSVIRTLLDDDNIACKAQICWMPNGLAQEPQINVEVWHQEEAIALVIATLRALAEHEEVGR